FEVWGCCRSAMIKARLVHVATKLLRPKTKAETAHCRRTGCCDRSTTPSLRRATLAAKGQTKSTGLKPRPGYGNESQCMVKIRSDFDTLRSETLTDRAAATRVVVPQKEMHSAVSRCPRATDVTLGLKVSVHLLM